MLEKDSQGMYDPWNVPEDCQDDVDEEVGIAATLEEDA